jgi:class 3 adenylate cyclase
VSDPVTTATDPNAPSAERRQITVLFADMVGFTAISERLGEEGTFGLIQPIYELLAGAVKEQGGSVKDFFGDGAMALFGASDPLEDAPLRACRAGLLIHERLASAAAPIEAKYGIRPQMRVGVNSGLAVVTQLHGQNGPVTALGDTVNLASRLQNLAEPGTVYLSESTQRLVQGLVEATFAGAHAIKGKAKPQKVYRLDALRQNATRFEAALARGLSPYVGRERELEMLQRAFEEARGELRVIDIVAEAGMGKSRLLYEFRQRIRGEQAFILTGSCSPDGHQTPFLPFIEVVRRLFQLRSGEAESEVASKLEIGLNALDLHSGENLGLLLNLLGHEPPERALVGLDAALIGLRTRALLQRLLAARCRSSVGVVLIEDLHWIDSASRDVLGRIVDDVKKLNLLILYTRRPQYEPIWRERPVVKTLRLEPLAAVDIQRLVQARLGAKSPPETLVRLVIEKAEGNALFAEEILGFLSDRGALRADGGKVELDAGAVPAALPASLQSLLTARVGRLAPLDRTLLQAAAVIGRRFDPQLLAAAVNFGGDADARLIAMQAHDLVRTEGKSGDYAFKHALVRDALYQSLLTGARAALHLKIAEEIERRSGNRLGETVDALAHHYSQTDRADKAFAYLAMAGAKSLGVYSFNEADNHFAAAVALLDKDENCADDEQVADLLANYTLSLNLSLRLKVLKQVVVRFARRLDRLGDNTKRVLIQHHYVLCLVESAEYRLAETVQAQLTAMAVRLGDARSKAYALTSAMEISVIASPKQGDVFDAMSREAVAAASSLDDPYLHAVASARRLGRDAPGSHPEDAGGGGGTDGCGPAHERPQIDRIGNVSASLGRAGERRLFIGARLRRNSDRHGMHDVRPVGRRDCKDQCPRPAQAA